MTKQGSCRPDDVLDALATRERRRVLVSLLERECRCDYNAARPPTTDAELTDADDLEIRLFHVELPTLARSGFIEWDPEAGIVERGPRWERIAPLVELIREHHDEIPHDWL